MYFCTLLSYFQMLRFFDFFISSTGHPLRRTPLRRTPPPLDPPPPDPLWFLVPPGFHTTARELQTCTFKGPGASKKPPNFHEKTPREREKEPKWVREREKKREILGLQPLGPPTLRAPTLRCPTLRSSISPGSTLRPPSLRAEGLRAATFSGFGPLRSLFSSCCSFVLFVHF